MKKRIAMRGAIVSVIHFVLVLLLFAIAYNDTMDDFERDEPTPPTRIQSVAHTMAPVLMQPFVSIWTPWMSKHLPRCVEWMVFLGSSAFWGFAIVLIWAVCSRKTHNVRAAGS